MRRGRNEGSITQRVDGRWEARVDLGWIDGKRARRSVYGRTRKEAHERLQAALRSHREGLVPAPARLTVGQYLANDFLPAARSSVRPATFASYSAIVNRHLIPTIGKVRLTALSVADVEALQRDRAARGRKPASGTEPRAPRPLSPRRVAMIRTVLRLALGRAVKHGLVPRNVAALASPPKQERHEIQPLEPSELRAFLSAIEGHRLEALFVLAVTSGMRSGELLGLTWADLHLERSEVLVRLALQRIDGAPQLVAPKSTAGRRTIALPTVAVEALRAHRVRQLEERIAAGPEWQPVIDDLVFCTALGRPLDQANLLRTLHGILERAGLPRRRFHDLRHSMATALLVAGVSPRVVMEMLGHSQISLTLGTYSHVLPEVQRDAADRMGALLAARS